PRAVRPVIDLAKPEGSHALSRCVFRRPPPRRGAMLRADRPFDDRSEGGCMARILVVDDRPDVAKAIARMLSNHDTATETDPRQAVARVEHGERFDIVLCDLNMPDMNGREVSDRLVHAHDPPPPIVLMMSGGENVDSLFATGRAV